jgi:hypothetical protein
MDGLNIMDSRDMSPNDMISHYKKAVLTKFLEQKIIHPNLSVQQIADSLKISMSTINRYKRDLNFPQKKSRKLTVHQKHDIAIKSAITKQRNKQFKEEISQLEKSNLSGEEFETKINELQTKYHQNGSLLSDRREGRSFIEDKGSTVNETPVNITRTHRNKKALKGGAGPMSPKESQRLSEEEAERIFDETMKTLKV